MATKKKIKKTTIAINPFLQKRMEIYQKVFNWFIQNWDELRVLDFPPDILDDIPNKYSKKLDLHNLHIYAFEDKWDEIREKKTITFKDLYYLFFDDNP